MPEAHEQFDPTNEFAQRLQRRTGTDPNLDITNQDLRETVQRIGGIASMGMASRELLRQEFFSLNEEQRKRQREKSSPYPANQIDPVMNTLASWVQELDQRAQRDDPLREIANNQRLQTEAPVKMLSLDQFTSKLKVLLS